MKLLSLLLVSGALVGWGLWRRWRYASDERPVSARWLRQQAQLGDRIECHGPAIRWPIRKVVNEAGRF